jgi:porphobilinogen synthase
MKRLQRLRATKHLRDLTSTVGFTRAHLVQPLFTVESVRGSEEIAGLRGTLRQDVESTVRQVESDLENGVTQFLLFPVPGSKKDRAFDHSFAAGAIRAIKSRFGSDLALWVDTCLCSSTKSGHCCVFHEEGSRAGQTDSDATLSELAAAAGAFAEAGADGISPSDMMDGRVAAIRAALDSSGRETTPIMSYSTKFASTFYGPFRNAADSAPKFGDRKAYQIDVRNRDDAIAASVRCAEEGADLLMVKPGMTSIDLIRPISERTGLGVGAYQVSGEYASLVLLEEKGLIQFEPALVETWNVFRRAGAQYIITYGARYAKRLGF